MHIKVYTFYLKYYYFMIKDFGIVFHAPIANILFLHLIRIGLTILGTILKDAAKYSILISLTSS